MQETKEEKEARKGGDREVLGSIEAARNLAKQRQMDKRQARKDKRQRR